MLYHITQQNFPSNCGTIRTQTNLIPFPKTSQSKVFLFPIDKLLFTKNKKNYMCWLMKDQTKRLISQRI